MSAFDLQGHGRVALITGAASGLGKATAATFGEAGYRLVLADRDAEAGSETESALRERGIEACFAATDVSDFDAVGRAVALACERWQQLDAVLNIAGISGRSATIDNLDPADLDRVLAVDLKGPFYVCRHAVSAFKASGGGVILNVASITAQAGSAYFAAYCAAKSGVVALTRSVARNSGRFNIRINCINPGSIAGTNLMKDHHQSQVPDELLRQRAAALRGIPLGRRAQPRDVAHLALFLASPLAAHIHGAVLTIDGGEHLGFH